MNLNAIPIPGVFDVALPEKQTIVKKTGSARGNKVDHIKYSAIANSGARGKHCLRLVRFSLGTDKKARYESAFCFLWLHVCNDDQNNPLFLHNTSIW
jgi:hypothetical protein